LTKVKIALEYAFFEKLIQQSLIKIQ